MFLLLNNDKEKIPIPPLDGATSRLQLLFEIVVGASTTKHLATSQTRKKIEPENYGKLTLGAFFGI